MDIPVGGYHHPDSALEGADVDGRSTGGERAFGEVETTVAGGPARIDWRIVSSSGPEAKYSLARRSLSLMLPAALTMSALEVLRPALSALLARGEDPETAISGFSVALSLTLLIALPQLRIQQLTLVFLEDRISLPQLRRFVAGWAVVVTSLAALVALTPLNNLVLGTVFSLEGAVFDDAAESLLWLVPLTGLLVLRAHLHGLSIRVERPSRTWMGAAVGSGTILSLGILFTVTDWLDGGVVAASAVTIGTAVEVGVMLVNTRKLLVLLPVAADPERRADYVAMTRFFGPLLFAALLPAMTQPVINAGMARAAEPVVSIAAVSLAFSLFQLLAFITNGSQSTTLSLLAAGVHTRRIRRIMMVVAVAHAGVAALVAFVPPITQLVLGTIMGAEGQLYEYSADALKIISLMPLALVMEQYYTSVLMRVRRTRPIVYVNIWRMIALLGWTFGVVAFTDLTGVYVGAAAIALTLVVEVLTTYGYAWRSEKDLATRDLRYGVESAE